MRNKGFAKYVITFLVSLTLALLVSYSRGVMDATQTKDRILCLCDGFSVSGLLFLCVGLLIVIAGEGVFDAFTYGMKKGLHHFIPGYTADDLGTLYDYKMAKSKKKKARPTAMLLSGIVILGIGILFMIAWYSMN